MIPLYEIILRLAIAGVLGSLVGLERERAESAAGLRTHALVALGAALFMLVSMFGFTNAIRPPGVVLDPSRVAAQIVTGIGFLGAGVIIFRKSIVRGLTTAASVWVVAAIGMAVGGGLYTAAIAATVLALAVLAVMKPLEKRLVSQRRDQAIRLVIDPAMLSVAELREKLARISGLVISRIDLRSEPGSRNVRVVILTRSGTPELIAQVCDMLAESSGVLNLRSAIHENEG